MKQSRSPNGQVLDLEARQKRSWNRQRQLVLDKLRLQIDSGLNRLPTKDELERAKCKFNTRVTGNAIEAEFYRRAKAEGWVASKRGWPDFFMWKDGRIALVEVKPDGERLKPSQAAILVALTAYGVPCFTWRPTSGFKRVTRKDVKEAIEEAML